MSGCRDWLCLCLMVWCKLMLLCLGIFSLAGGLFLSLGVLFGYLEKTQNFRSVMDQIADVSEQALTVGCSAMLRGVAVSGPVFLSCDVSSTPDLNTAPELGFLRSLLSPSNAHRSFIAYHLEVEVWRYRLVLHGRSHVCEEGWAKFQEESCFFQPTPPPFPTNLASAHIFGAAAEVEIGDPSAPFVLTPPLRWKLLAQLEPVGLEVNSLGATWTYDPATRKPVAQNFIATVPEKGPTVLETGQRSGDVRASLTGYQVRRVSVFAVARQGVPAPDEAVVGAEQASPFWYFLLRGSERDMDLEGWRSYTVWPRVDANNTVDPESQQRVLLSEWGDMKGAFVLDGPYTKTSAVEKLRSEARAGFTSWLPLWLFYSILSALCTPCLGCVALGDDWGPTVVCGVLFFFVSLQSIANFFVILISFIVQGSYVPLACVWLVLVCFCGCIFAMVDETKRRTNGPEGEGIALIPRNFWTQVQPGRAH